MILRVGLIAALSITTLGWPAVGFAQSPQVIVVQAADEQDGQNILCKYRMETGTRFKSKTCKTKLQWEQMRIQQQRDAKEMFERPMLQQGSLDPGREN